MSESKSTNSFCLSETPLERKRRKIVSSSCPSLAANATSYWADPSLEKHRTATRLHIYHGSHVSVTKNAKKKLGTVRSFCSAIKIMKFKDVLKTLQSNK